MADAGKKSVHRDADQRAVMHPHKPECRNERAILVLAAVESLLDWPPARVGAEAIWNVE